MIDYPIDFLENQTDLSEMGYYIVMTGGGTRVKIDGLLGDVDGDGNSLNHISWNSVGSGIPAAVALSRSGKCPSKTEVLI